MVVTEAQSPSGPVPEDAGDCHEALSFQSKSHSGICENLSTSDLRRSDLTLSGCGTSIRTLDCADLSLRVRCSEWMFCHFLTSEFVHECRHGFARITSRSE